MARTVLAQYIGPALKLFRMDTRVKIRPAIVADAPALSRLGAATFRETFEGENTPEDMERYIAEAFTSVQQSREIADPSSAVLVAEHQDDGGRAELVGYAHLISGDVPDAVEGFAPMELKRIYVSKTWQGRRVAQSLMDASINAARDRGAQTLWLGVWERNPRAVAFYAKYGFSRVGEHRFVLGNDEQTDWLFARPISKG